MNKEARKQAHIRNREDERDIDPREDRIYAPTKRTVEEKKIGVRSEAQINTAN